MSNLSALWSDVRPEMLARDCAIVLGCVVAGWLLAAILRRILISSGADRFLRVPWAAADAAPTPLLQRGRQRTDSSAVTSALGWFCMLSVWAGMAAWLASLHGFAPFSRSVGFVLSRSWQAAVVVFIAVLASGWLAHAVYGLFRTPWLKRELDALFASTTGADASFSETAARAVCVIVYAAFLLFVPVVVAGVFNLSPLASLSAPAWQMCARLLTVFVAFAVGYLGLAWVRSQGRLPHKEGVDHSEIEYYVGLGVIVVTTLIALMLLVGTSSGTGLFGILVLFALATVLIWPVRTHLRDLWSGLLLRLQNVKNVTLDGEPVEVKTVGPIVTTIVRDGQEQSRRNSTILSAVVAATGKPA